MRPARSRTSSEMVTCPLVVILIANVFVTTRSKRIAFAPSIQDQRPVVQDPQNAPNPHSKVQTDLGATATRTVMPHKPSTETGRPESRLLPNRATLCATLCSEPLKDDIFRTLFSYRTGNIKLLYFNRLTSFLHSHSIVPGGLLVMSHVTTPCLLHRVAIQDAVNGDYDVS
jgi:hypothetical protein